MLDTHMIAQWCKALLDAKTRGRWFGAAKAAVCIAGVMFILGAVVWLFVLMCELMVLGLSLIGQTTHEFFRLYSEQLPLVQFVLLLALCWFLWLVLARSSRFTARLVMRPTPAFGYLQPTPRGRTTHAYAPRSRYGY